MMKKAGFLSSLNGLHCCACSTSPSTNTSPSLSLRPRVRRVRSQSSTGWRSYADSRTPRGPDFRDNIHWPATKTPPCMPTPYEIFELDKGAIYTKHRFYELVKIYHPDRSGYIGNICGNISHGERLERYRLVVLAHEILSDPIKRRAYDSHGAGWGDHQGYGTRHTRGYHDARRDSPFGFGPDCDSSPFANATWEDWERWYRRTDNSGRRQDYGGTYVNPNAFASFIILLAVISGVAQATRAGQYSGTLEERAQAFSEETSLFLSSRADHLKEQNITSDGRIKHFLERRDPTKYGLKEDEEGVYKKYFSPHLHPIQDRTEEPSSGDG